MNYIKKVPVEMADKFVLTHKLWGYDSYDAEVYAQLAYDEECFTVRFTVGEYNPRRTMYRHFEFVDKDSCVEFFVNFTPKCSDKYINFEVNALGSVNASFRNHVSDGVPLTLEEIEGLQVVPEVYENYWILTYKIRYDFIRKYFQAFDINSCEYLLCNLYKCGSWTDNVHYLSHFKLGNKERNFHRPDYFGKIFLEK